MAASDSGDENTRPAEVSLPATKQQQPASGNRIGANGVILGPDGKPCKACNSLKAFGAVAAGGGGGGNKGKGKATSANAMAGAGGFGAALAGAGAGTAMVPADAGAANPYKACPADVEQLGRHTWTFLHSTAAYYPDAPSEQHQQNARSLFNALPALYPCRHCADELSNEMLKIGPPDVSSRLALSTWLCQIHNEVNTRLGKKEFDCAKVLRRWKDGWDDGRCD